MKDSLSFPFANLFNTRRSDQTFPLNPAGDLSVSRGTQFSIEQSFGLAPSLTLALPGDWDVSLIGTYGRDKVEFGAETFFGTEGTDAGSGFYRNIGQSAELAGSGRLIELPAGFAKLAIGAGFRRNALERFPRAGGPRSEERSVGKTWVSKCRSWGS